MPALHIAMTSGGKETRNIGAPITGACRRPWRMGGRRVAFKLVSPYRSRQGCSAIALLARSEIERAGQGPRIGSRRENLVLLDLLRARRRQGRDELDPARRLEVGELGVAMFEQ